MLTRYYHGNISPLDFAHPLISNFNRGNLRAQQFGDEKKIVVQVATRDMPNSGGQTALSVSIEKAEDGVAIQIGKQSWLGVAASLGVTAISAWRNPWSLLSRLDDVAQDIEYLQLSEQVIQVIESTALMHNATYELSDRLRRIVCNYCQSANPIDESNCIACGAPLGTVQPKTCHSCGYVIKPAENICPNCGESVA